MSCLPEIAKTAQLQLPRGVKYWQQPFINKSPIWTITRTSLKASSLKVKATVVANAAVAWKDTYESAEHVSLTASGFLPNLVTHSQFTTLQLAL